MTAYDKATADRLCCEARSAAVILDSPESTLVYGSKIWLRNNLAAIADHLEAAGAEVERLTKHNNEVACALGVEGEPDATVAHTAWEARGLIMAGVTVRTERDALRTEVAKWKSARDECERQFQDKVREIATLMNDLDETRARVAELEGSKP